MKYLVYPLFQEPSSTWIKTKTLCQGVFWLKISFLLIFDYLLYTRRRTKLDLRLPLRYLRSGHEDIRTKDKDFNLD